MAECPSLTLCPFFNDRMANRPAMSELMKKQYCRTDNRECARWRVAGAMGKQAVPEDLFPAQFERARLILAGRTAGR